MELTIIDFHDRNCTDCMNSFHLFKTAHKADTIIISIFLMRKLRLREVIEVVYSHVEKT